MNKTHDERVDIGKATDYICFAGETWKCIRLLILAHSCIIQLYCINNNTTVNLYVINTDVVEWFFGNTRSMVRESTNKLRAKAAAAADRKVGAFS